VQRPHSHRVPAGEASGQAPGWASPSVTSLMRAS
jgi:hypothetical protein